MKNNLQYLLNVLQNKSSDLYELMKDYGVWLYKKERYIQEYGEQDYNDIKKSLEDRISKLEAEVYTIKNRIISIENKPTTGIPKGGDYCYDCSKGTCMYWHSNPMAMTQSNGECLYLGLSDDDSNEDEATLLLWDQIKYCCL